MPAFKQLRQAVQAKVQALFTLAATRQGVLLIAHAEKDYLWDLYLESIPKEHNQIFRERRYYDGNYDKHFIRKLGGLKFISSDLEVDTIWNIDLPEDNFFGDVVKRLHNAVLGLPNRDYFFTTEKVAGHLANVDNYDPTITWEHFYTVVPSCFVTDSLGEKQGKLLENKQLLQRSVESLTKDSAELVKELIETGDLYRGNELLPTVKGFIEIKDELKSLQDHILTSETQDNWYWLEAYRLGDKCRIRNTVIGTLMEDISQGMALEQAVKSFESKVAPTNYKRTTAIVTPKMVEHAKETVTQLGYGGSVYRRLAIDTDIPVTERLFTAVKRQALDVFYVVKEESKSKVRELGNVDEISWDKIWVADKGIEVVLRVLGGGESILEGSVEDSEVGARACGARQGAEFGEIADARALFRAVRSVLLRSTLTYSPVRSSSKNVTNRREPLLGGEANVALKMWRAILRLFHLEDQVLVGDVEQRFYLVRIHCGIVESEAPVLGGRGLHGHGRSGGC